MPNDEAGQQAWGFARDGERSERDIDAMVQDALWRVRRLSPQSREILGLLVEGSGNQHIGACTGLDTQGVIEARALLLAELDVVTTTDAIRIGIYAAYRQELDQPLSPD